MKKSLLVGLIAIALVVAILPVASVFAENNNNNGNSNSILKNANGMINKMDNMLSQWENNFNKNVQNRQSQSVSMNANGDFKVTGVTVNSVNVSGNSMNVSFYGFSRDVNVSGAKFHGPNGDIALGDISAGDKLVGTGNFNSSTHAITVSDVYDLTLNLKSASDIQSKIQSLMDIVNQLQAQLKALLNRKEISR